MTRGATKRAILIAASLFAAGLAASSIPGPPASLPVAVAEGAPSTGNVTEFQWQAPTNLSGTFAMMLRLEVSQTTFCEASPQAAGAFDDENPISFWQRTVITGEDVSGLGQGTNTWRRAVQVHAGSIADSRQVTPFGGQWGTGGFDAGVVGESMEITLVAFGLGESEDPHLKSPLSIRVTCDDPFNVTTLMASQQARSFTQGTLTDGIGATVNVGPLAPESFSKYDRLETSFDASMVRFQAILPDQGDFEGTLALHHPGGSVDWSLRPGILPSERFVAFDGTPGGYAIELDWHGRDYSDDPMGILIGLDPVEHLDDAV